jgi:hypothetical protein
MANKEILKQIRAFAQMLPVVTHKTRVLVSGATILEKLPDAKIDGVPVEPTKTYSVPAEMPTNHYRAMKKLYQQKGQDGLYLYAEMMRQSKEGEVQLAVETIGNMVVRKNEITYGF